MNDIRTEPVDQALLSESNYDLKRPTYVCPVCAEQGEQARHKYVDECPFYDE